MKNNTPEKFIGHWFERNPKKTLTIIFLIFIFLIFIGSEIIARIYKEEYRFKNFRSINLMKSAFPAQFDKHLGYIPRPGFNSTKNVWKNKVTILEDGIRGNDNHINLINSAQKGVIFAVGDSFTFGDGCSNNETWPSYLERKIGVRVVNAGVFGYGLDQTIIRSEDLLIKYKPKIIIISFIWDDIMRCGLKVRTNVPKPYFIIRNNNLILINNHLSNAQIIKLEQQQNITLNIFGYSLLISKIMSMIAPSYWQTGAFLHTESTGEDYMKIACMLMDRLKKIENKTLVKFIIMPQYHPNDKDDDLKNIDILLRCSIKSGLKIINLYEKLMSIKKDNYNEYLSLFLTDGHTGPKGNKYIAEEIGKYLILEELYEQKDGN